MAQEIAPFGVKITVLEPGGMRTDWAGSSMSIPPISEPYRQTVGAFVDMIRTYDPDAGVANSADPARIAEIIADLSGRDDAPVRILLGKDAVQYWDAAGAALAESDAKWRSVSESAWS
ncbi:hypothetical protein [Streptomyces sp. Ag109_O5-10]|uniref:hypothetical protein n=1 Tax=Streptomyces sp. Ag109_O5-10 TaxID=1855349 RepID=UPI000B832C05|nr:hypothetical protein [Streptomyces sp. Ag109_O5-10]